MAAAASASTAVSNTSSTNSFAKPLNAKRRRECIAVKESYLEFFNISSFKKGWAKPLLHLEDVEVAFDLAAEIVVRVRRELDQSGASHKQRNLRLTTGAAREFLHQVESKPQEDLDAFVRNLVYATFKDASGFVEGLAQQSLDKWISEAMAMRATAERTKSRDVAQQLRSLATSISQKLHALTDQPLTDERIEKVSREHLLNLHRLLKMLRSVDSELDIVTAHADDKNVPAVATEKTEGKVATESVATPAGEENKAPETMEVVSEAKESKDAPATAASPAEAKSFEEKRAETHDAKTEAASQDTAQPAATEPVETPASGTDASGGSSSDSEVKSRVLPHTVADEAHMLQIKKVQEEFDSLRHDALDLAAEADRLRPEQFRDDSEAGIRKLDQMQRRCMELAHHLMKELLMLDDMVGMSAESRPARKAQVERIQQTLDDVELLQRKISGMISQVREEEAKSKRVPKLKVMAAKAADEAKAAEAKRRDEEELARKKLEEERERKEREEMEARERARVEAAMKAKAEKRPRSALASVEKKQRDTDVAAAASQQEAEESDDESADAGEAKKARQAVGGLWRKLRLRPEFESKEHGDAFTITSYIPGMRQEDIELNLGPNGASLEIKGCRYPSAQEEVIMRRQLLQLRRSQAHGMYYPPQDGDENALLRMGAGRYGAFAQAFTLPKGIDVSKISASYEGGVLRVVIPKIPQPRRRPAYDPYAAAYGNPRRSFLDADDMWW